MNLKPTSCYNPLHVVNNAGTSNQCCPLAPLSKGFAYPDGSCASGVLVVTDKLSKSDAMDGLFLRPHTAAGSIFNRALSAAGVARDQVGIYGVTACDPPNGSLAGESYELGAIEHCSKNLRAVYDHFQQPPVILALGAVAARTLTGLSGERLSLDMIQGFPLSPEGRTVPYMLGKSIVVPSYGPEYIERGNSQLLLVLIRDIRFAFQLAQRLKARFSDVPQVQAIFDTLQHKPQYALHANHFHLQQLLRDMRAGYVKRLSYDFETTGLKASEDAMLAAAMADGDVNYQAFTNQRIIQVNFSIDRNHAIVADYDAQTAPIIQDILACTPEVPKIGHNVYCFDQPVARFNGFEIRGTHIDTMWQYHHIYPDLPGKGKANKGEAEGASLSSNDGDEDGALAPLQFCASFYGFPLPWKHLFKLDPHLYGAYDSDAALWVHDGCNNSLEALGLKASHEKYVIQLRTVLDEMERRGLPCSPSKLRTLSEHLTGMLKESSVVIATCVPDEALSTTPAKGYAKPPKALLAGIDEALAVHQSSGLTRETFDVAAYALAKRYVWRSHSLVGQRCKCVKITKNASDALPSCPSCKGTGLKATKAKVACDACLNGEGRIDCLECHGVGFTATVSVPKSKAKVKVAKARQLALEFAALVDGDDGEVLNLRISNVKDDSEDDPAETLPVPESEAECAHSNIKHFRVASDKVEYVSYCIDCSLKMKSKIKCCACVRKPLPSCSRCQGTGKIKGIRQGVKCACLNRANADPSCPNCFGSSLFTGSEMRWCKLVPFNVGSPKQMLNYAKFRGYKIPMNSKRKIAMDSETIGKLARSTGDPLYVHTQRHRVLAKIKTSYADSWLAKLQNTRPEGQEFNPRALEIAEAEKEWHARIKESGLATIHSSFQFRPATKQLSSKNPNVQVKPSTKHGGFRAELATMFGEAVEAPNGYALVECCAVGTKVLLGAGQYAPVETLRKGSQLMGFTKEGKEWVYRYTKVVNNPVRKMKRCVKLKTNALYGNTITVSEDHSFLVLLMDSAYEPVWRKAIELRLGDEIVARHPLDGSVPRTGDKVSIGGWKVEALEMCKTEIVVVETSTGTLITNNLFSHNCDYRSFHALTLGYEARDSSYIRLARLDAHSFLCANMLHLQGAQDCLALPDDELRAYLKYVKENFKKERDSKAKPAILGYGFGMGARKLYDLNQDSFRDVEEAKYTIDMLNSCFPLAAAYRNDSPELAHRQMYLISPHRCIRWFTDVKKWNSEKQRWNHGRDWEKSIAFRPANIAFCVIQQRMLDLKVRGLAAKYNLINNIHDALLFCPKKKDVEECAHEVKALMELPDPTVTDPEGRPLWCEVEVKHGSNWAKMDDLKVN